MIYSISGVFRSLLLYWRLPVQPLMYPAPVMSHITCSSITHQKTLFICTGTRRGSECEENEGIFRQKPVLKPESKAGPLIFIFRTLDVCDNDGHGAVSRCPPQPLAEVNHVLKQLRAGTPLHTTYTVASEGKGGLARQSDHPGYCGFS